ncbi:MAG: nucleotidyltransferase [Candidatus Altiarchaeales archaeon]|nr:nucleotidyltransferase [Candidatus Altiarchaeota archaeon]MBU4266805.1 nucleotidyltransferase [Candidatus Altiarchaeota archaeon]MBU4406469.1 nucleotidyltransferase [Candidatus Altiarchaeota archaeon]MBU4436691.1 nucleotidyltransferase [Candidatus Altiarchaeota archaeon]MCG2782651.1 nucleotidyltransferase [Candidatus Altiarchaeales archaeon]
MYYGDVLRELNDKGVRYLVVGGVALVLHGVVRLTVDLDIMIDLGHENVMKFLSVMEGLGYRPRVPVDAKDFADPGKRREWMEEKNMRVFSFINPKKSANIIDVFVENPMDFEQAYASKKAVDADGFRIPLVSTEDLKGIKRASGREQDLADIEALEEFERMLKDEEEK